MIGPSLEAVLDAAADGDERAFRAWVFTVARHRAVDRWRRTTRRHDELVPLLWAASCGRPPPQPTRPS
jgi:DNA-directed RNA polymerase specialized sigma24 family protein